MPEIREGMDSPVFIGGLSYSGKTQLRQLLEAVPGLSLHRRTGLWAHRGEFGDLGKKDNRERARRAMQAKKVAASLNPDWDKVFAEFELGSHTYAKLFGVIQGQHAEMLGTSRWGEQYGRIVQFAQEVFGTYRDARMIHMIRHPSGRLPRLSERRSRRPGWVGWETGEGVVSLRLARANTERYPHRYMVISYEQLSIQPVETVRDVCEFLGESVDPILHSDALERVRFDSLEPAESERVLDRPEGEFPMVALSDWPTLPAPTGPEITRIRRSVPAMLSRFPVDSMAMWYRLYAPERLLPR